MVALLDNPMKLVADSGADRRMFPRKELKCVARGKRLDHSIQARQDPRLALTVRDVSMGGLSAIVEKPIGPGEKLNVFFPASERGSQWDAIGRVIRCSPSGAGYRIAVEFDAIPMAA